MESEQNHIDRSVAGFSAEQILEFALRRFDGKIALATSFGAEDQVLTRMLCSLGKPIRIFTLDTGRLPQETYDVMEVTQKKYGIAIKVYCPEAHQVESMVESGGVNLFYRSVENRKQCCYVRKIEPLKRALKGLDAWICGLRKEQSVTRQAVEPIAWDDQFGLYKICPLADWTTQQVWDYIRTHEIPYHPLHDKGYPSIGCAPCTRAVEAGGDIRSGRWWWEQPEHKECGLHWAACSSPNLKQENEQ